jgi:hypothetical protein
MNSQSHTDRAQTPRTHRLIPLLAIMLITAAGALTGCARQSPTLFAAPQADGWSATPMAINNRFTEHAALAPDSGTPIGDEGYSLTILTVANDWNYRDSHSFFRSFVKHPHGHAWLILESPHERIEGGHAGNYGEKKPRYHEGVIQHIKDGDPNPITYIWKTLDDGQFESGNPGYDPTFAWRLPLTQAGYHRIHDYIMNRDYTRFCLRTHNCGEMVTQAASLAGVNLASVIRITLPATNELHGHTLRLWTDPKYSTFDVRSFDVLELDLRTLAKLGIGRDATADYRADKPYERLRRVDHPAELRSISVTEASGQ